jgi:hypothetical protein
MWRDFYSGCGQTDEAATKLIYLVLRDTEMPGKRHSRIRSTSLSVISSFVRS